MHIDLLVTRVCICTLTVAHSPCSVVKGRVTVVGISSLESFAMEDDEYSKYMPENPNAFYCNICKVHCASAINLQTHFLGLRHKAVEEALKAHGLVKTLTASGDSAKLPESLPQFIYTGHEKQLGETLEDQLNACKDSEPAIGLEYIIEYRSDDNLIYECTLCTCQARLTNMFMHVLGIKHKIAYLKKHHPEIGEVKGRGARLKNRLKELAWQVERVDGRKRIKSTTDVPVPKEDIYSVQQSDFLVTWFSEEDKAKKIEFPKPGAKKAEDAEAAKSKCDESNNSEDKKNPEENAVQKQNAWLLDSDSDSEEFTNNEGLLKYLKNFEIVDEDDAAFVLKVTQKFTDALVVYRERVSERKGFPWLEQYSGCPDYSEQKTSLGAVSERKQYNECSEYSEKKASLEGVPDRKPFSKSPDLSKPKPSLEAVPDLKPYIPPPDHSKQKTPLEGVPDLKPFRQFPDHSKQKTSLEASAPHSDYDFSQWELPVEHSFEEVGTNSDVKIPAKRKASELNTNPSKDKYKNHKHGAFVPTFKEIPNNEDSCDADGPHEPHGPHPTSCNARHFGASKDPCASSHNRQGHKSGQNRGATSWNPKKKGAPSSRQRQHGQPPFGPSESDDDIVEKFLRSIRNMDVDEVAGTLQKISETNPAFSASVGPRKTVWIIGHSIVYRAGDYAASSGWGPALGLEDRLRVTWMGQRRMQWDALLPTISSQVSRLGSPDAIVIQLGEDDLPEQKGVDLTINMTADLHTLISRLPNTRLFWSDLLERREWSKAEAPEKVDLVRKKVTAAAGRLIEATGGFVIQHPDITFRQTALYRVDGVNLTEWGLDIWLHGIRDGLLRWLQS